MTANNVFQATVKTRNIEAEKNVFQKLSIQTENVLKDRDYELFKDLDNICDCRYPSLHSTKLKKKILSIFLLPELVIFCGLRNAKKCNVRHRN